MCVCACMHGKCVVRSVCVCANTEQRAGAGSYHVRVGLQYEASLFPPLLSVVVLKHIAQTLKHKLEVRKCGGGTHDGVERFGWKVMVQHILSPF